MFTQLSKVCSQSAHLLYIPNALGNKVIREYLRLTLSTDELFELENTYIGEELAKVSNSYVLSNTNKVVRQISKIWRQDNSYNEKLIEEIRSTAKFIYSYETYRETRPIRLLCNIGMNYLGRNSKPLDYITIKTAIGLQLGTIVHYAQEKLTEEDCLDITFNNSPEIHTDSLANWIARLILVVKNAKKKVSIVNKNK